MVNFSRVVLPSMMSGTQIQQNLLTGRWGGWGAKFVENVLKHKMQTLAIFSTVSAVFDISHITHN